MSSVGKQTIFGWVDKLFQRILVANYFDNLFIILAIFQANTYSADSRHSLQCLKYEDLILSFVIYDWRAFGFLTVPWTKEDLKMSLWALGNYNFKFFFYILWTKQLILKITDKKKSIITINISSSPSESSGYCLGKPQCNEYKFNVIYPKVTKVIVSACAWNKRYYINKHQYHSPYN